MKRVLAFALASVLAGSLYAAEPPQDASTATTKTTKKRTAAKKSGPTVSSQLMELKQAMDAQQQQIQQLSQQVQSRDQHIQQLEQRLDQSQAAAAQAQAKADAAASQTAEQAQTVSSLKSDVTDLRGNATNVALSLQETQKSVRDQLESPTAIHFKGITITPGASWRVNLCIAITHSVRKQLPFNSLNYPGSGQDRISRILWIWPPVENLNASGRQNQLRQTQWLLRS